MITDQQRVQNIQRSIIANAGSIANLDKKLQIYLKNQYNITSLNFKSPGNILIDYAKICLEMKNEFRIFNGMLNSISLINNKQSNLLFNLIKPIDDFYQYYSEHIILAENRLEPYFILINDKSIFLDRHCPAKLQGAQMYSELKITEKIVITLISKASQAQLATSICHNYNFSF